MKRIIIIIIIMSVMLIALAYGQTKEKAAGVRLSPRLLNYQGYLTDTQGNPLNDTFDFIFRIYDASSAGSQLWTETQIEVPILKGIFNVLLGSVTPIPDTIFTKGANRWLELRFNSQTLSPRTQIVSAPYAYTATYSDTALYAKVADADNDWTIAGSNQYSAVSGNVGIGTSSPIAKLDITGNIKIADGTHGAGKVLTSDASGLGSWQTPAGSTNYWTYRITDTADTTLQMGGPWGLARSGNVLYGNADSTHVNLGIASTTGEALSNNKYCTVAGGRFNTAEGAWSYVGGGSDNTADGFAATADGGYSNSAGGYAAVVGGGSNHVASVPYATVAGGRSNIAGGEYATVGGGFENTVSGSMAIVGGGYGNTAGDASDDSASVIAGGFSNSITGKCSFIGGGLNNAVTYRYGAVVGGYADTATGQYSFIGGGQSNIASLDNAVVTGGNNNTASGGTSAVCGGANNLSSNAFTFIGGGTGNVASESRTVVGGGDANTAGGWCSTVGGGYNNAALEYASVVAGGREDTARAVYGAVFSGRLNLAGDAYNDTGAVVCGGYNNKVREKYASVLGGRNNRAGGQYSSVVGGINNIADSNFATISGGSYNTAANNYASIGGGIQNTASGTYARVGGGQQNVASGYSAVVSGGSCDTASGNNATVSGGLSNYASGYMSAVGGGEDNIANQSYTTVAGGEVNTASGGFACVGGGAFNTAGNNSSTVGGGYSNCASGYASTVGGGFYDTSAAYYCFSTGNHSKVVDGHDNSAAFTTSHTIAANQVRAAAFSTGIVDFAMDHPKDPMNKILNQYGVSSDEVQSQYSGSVILSDNGRAIVDLPDYFDEINRSPRIQLTGVGSSDVYVAEKIKNNKFVVGGKPGIEVYWEVTAERTDVHAEIARIQTPVVQEKTGGLRGHSIDDDAMIGIYDGLRAKNPELFRFKTDEGRGVHEQSKR